MNISSFTIVSIFTWNTQHIVCKLSHFIFMLKYSVHKISSSPNSFGASHILNDGKIIICENEELIRKLDGLLWWQVLKTGRTFDISWLAINQIERYTTFAYLKWFHMVTLFSKCIPSTYLICYILCFMCVCIPIGGRTQPEFVKTHLFNFRGSLNSASHMQSNRIE